MFMIVDLLIDLDLPLNNPAPMTAETAAWVVDIGIPYQNIMYGIVVNTQTTNAFDNPAATPLMRSNLVILRATVVMTLAPTVNPPMMIPKAPITAKIIAATISIPPTLYPETFIIATYTPVELLTSLAPKLYAEKAKLKIAKYLKTLSGSNPQPPTTYRVLLGFYIG
jgi:hypothetical protein